jgi:hypothetical protein
LVVRANLGLTKVVHSISQNGVVREARPINQSVFTRNPDFKRCRLPARTQHEDGIYGYGESLRLCGDGRSRLSPSNATKLFKLFTKSIRTNGRWYRGNDQQSGSCQNHQLRSSNGPWNRVGNFSRTRRGGSLTNLKLHTDEHLVVIDLWKPNILAGFRKNKTHMIVPKPGWVKEVATLIRYLLVCSSRRRRHGVHVPKVVNETGHYYRMSFMGPTLKMPIMSLFQFYCRNDKIDRQGEAPFGIGCQFFCYANLTKLVKDQIDRSGMLPNVHALFNGRENTLIYFTKRRKI